MLVSLGLYRVIQLEKHALMLCDTDAGGGPFCILYDKTTCIDAKTLSKDLIELESVLFAKKITYMRNASLPSQSSAK